MAAMIEAAGLTKYYGRLPAVQDVSFRVERGEIVGFLGPNGAGKTTILRMLTACLPSTRGQVRVNGRDAAKEPREVKRLIGYLPENVPLYSELSVTRFLRFAAIVKGVARDRLRTEVERVVEACALRGHERRLIRHLSKGLKQRVGLAQALLNDPPLLILDEPTTGLDPAQIVEMRELIRGLGGKRTVVLSSHILPEVSQLCRRVIIVNRGRIVAEDTPDGLGGRVEAGKSLRVLLRVGGVPLDELEGRLLAVEGVFRVIPALEPGLVELHVDRRPEVRAEIARSVVASDWPLFEMTPRELSLEEIFVRLVAGEEGGRAS